MRERLDEGDVAADPIAQFRAWFDEAVQAQLPMVNAMTLATASARRPAFGAHRAAEGRRRARLRLLHATTKAARAASSPRIRARRCSSTGSSSSAKCASKARRENVCRRNPTTISRRGRRAAASPRSPRVQSAVVRDRAALEARYARHAASATARRRRDRRGWGGYRVDSRSDRVLAGPRRTGCTTGCCIRRSGRRRAGRSCGLARRRGWTARGFTTSTASISVPSHHASAATAAEHGIVSTHAQTMPPATPQRTADTLRAAPTPTIAPGDGVRGRYRDAEAGREEQRRRAARLGAEAAHRLQLGDALSHRLHDAPAAEQRAEPDRDVARDHDPAGNGDRAWSNSPRRSAAAR